MKKLLTLLLLFLTTLALACTGKDVYLTVEGQFLAKKNVNYEIYKVNDGQLEFQSQHTNVRYYKVNVEVGNDYVVKFTAPDNQIKYLYIEAIKTGTYELNVDFNNDNSGRITYDTKTSEYNIIPVTSINYVKN